MAALFLLPIIFNFISACRDTDTKWVVANCDNLKVFFSARRDADPIGML